MIYYYKHLVEPKSYIKIYIKTEKENLIYSDMLIVLVKNSYDKNYAK